MARPGEASACRHVHYDTSGTLTKETGHIPIVIVAMPYGSLGSDRLSAASRTCLEKAVDWWQKSMHTSKHKTYLVVAGYDGDSGREIALRKDLLAVMLHDTDLSSNVLELSATNEETLAQRISRVRELLPVETITVFAESRNTVSVKAIFKRKFGKTLRMRKFKSEFEHNHQWITTSTPLAWRWRNWLLRLWFESKKRLGRGMRKKIRYWFRM
jgi:hypothetical protein